MSLVPAPQVAATVPVSPSVEGETNVQAALEALETALASAGISGSGTAGKVTTWTGAGSIGDANQLYWNGIDHWLGVNMSTNSTGYTLALGVTGGYIWNDWGVIVTDGGSVDSQTHQVLDNSNNPAGLWAATTSNQMYWSSAVADTASKAAFLFKSNSVLSNADLAYFQNGSGNTKASISALGTVQGTFLDARGQLITDGANFNVTASVFDTVTAYNSTPNTGLSFGGKRNVGGDTSGMAGVGFLKANTTSEDCGGILRFFTRPTGAGSGTSQTERGRVGAAGRWLINTTTDDGSTTFQISGTAKVSGALTLGTALSIGNGGTGQTTRAAALAALLPSDSGHGGEYLQADGSGVFSWAAASGGGSLPADATGWLHDDGAGTLTWSSPAFSNITGSVAAAQLPNPGASSLGGIQSKAAVTSNFLTAISTAGVVSAAQPAFTDISGSVAASQLPNPSASTLGGIQSYAAVTNQWIRAISTSGVPTSSQPAFTDISGSVAASQLPNPSASTLGGVQSKASTSHQFLTQISTSGVVSAAQPASADISDASASATASVLMLRDASANVRVNNLIEGFTTTATAAGTTTLAVTDTYTQIFTGSTTQTVVLPDATTLVVGHQFRIVNRSSGTVTVNKNGGSLALAVTAGGDVIFTATAIGTSAGTWDAALTTASGGLSGLTSGRIPYATAATTVADNTSLQWDNTNTQFKLSKGQSAYDMTSTTTGIFSMVNSDTSAGQTYFSFIFGSTPKAGIRADFNGGLTLGCNGGGSGFVDIHGDLAATSPWVRVKSGHVMIGTQTDTGNSELLQVAGNVALNTTSSNELRSYTANSGSNTAFVLNAKTTLSGSTKLIDIQNNGTSKFSIKNDGVITAVQLLCGQQLVQGAQFQPSGNIAALFYGTTNDGAGNVGAKVGCNNGGTAMSNATARLVSVQNNATEKAAFYADGRLGWPTGSAADVIGQATLSGGTVTVSTTAVKSTSLVFLTHAGGNVTNAGTLSVGTVTAGTSFVINSTNASDTDTVNWIIHN